MNDRKVKKLFELAKGDAPPTPPEGFDSRVVRAIVREPGVAPVTLWAQLDALFPRLAVSAALVMALCVLGDFYFSAANPSGLAGDVTELSDQWLFATSAN